MSGNDFVRRYHAYEDGLIRSFHEHPFFQNFLFLSEDAFIDFLLQLGHLSAEFVRWYERAKQGFTSEAAQEVVRQILRDEIPPNAPTHQDDRIVDLARMGVLRRQALNTRRTSLTRATLRRMYALVAYPQEHYDLRVLITLRVFGEILVSATYGYVVDAMKSRFGLRPEQSRFYAPHFFHDHKEGAEVADEAADGDHVCAFDAMLAELIVDEATLAIAREAAQQAYKARLHFHDQFLRRHGVFSSLRAALVLFVCIVGGSLGSCLNTFAARAAREEAREEWAEFLADAGVETRAFYLDCDRAVLERASLNAHPTEDLLLIGTSASCRAWWGDGP